MITASVARGLRLSEEDKLAKIIEDDLRQIEEEIRKKAPNQSSVHIRMRMEEEEADIVQDQLKEAGFTVTPHVFDPDEDDSDIPIRSFFVSWEEQS